MYANVIIEYGAKAVNKEFTYIVPNNIKDLIAVGHRVLVPFNNKYIEGFVTSLKDKYDGNHQLSEIKELCDEKPILNKEMLYIGDAGCYLISRNSARPPPGFALFLFATIRYHVKINMSN